MEIDQCYLCKPNSKNICLFHLIIQNHSIPLYFRAADNAKDLYNFVITMQLLTGGLIMIFSAFHFVFVSFD